MRASMIFVLLLCCAVACFAAPAPAPATKTAPSLAPHLAPASAPSASMPARTIDWGRPCTLVTTPSDASEILTNCTDCGSGTTAKPEPACTFRPQTATVGQYFDIFYHSSTHHLYMGPTACTYTSPAVEVCPNATADVVSAKTPCVVPFKTAGTYYISDSASNPGDTSDFCKNFGAQMQITVSAAAPTKAPASAPMAASG